MGGECGLVFVEVEDFSAIVENSRAKQPLDLKKLIVSLCQQLNKLTRIMPGNIDFQEELGEQGLQESEHLVSLVGQVSWLPCRLHFFQSQESLTHPVDVTEYAEFRTKFLSTLVPDVDRKVGVYMIQYGLLIMYLNTHQQG